MSLVSRQGAAQAGALNCGGGQDWPVVTNRTHRTRLARALADATGTGYQKALSLVDEAATAGALPSQLDTPGMSQALEVLLHRAAASGGTSPLPAPLEPAPIRAMRIPEARAAIRDAVTARIGAGFKYDLRKRQARWRRYPALEPASAPGRNPGCDATRVPPVPAARLTIDYDSDHPEVLFTWKARAGGAPDVRLAVPTGWQRDVARRGYAVLGGYPVLQVFERDADGQPSEISVAVIVAYFDSQTEGCWRAYGQAGTRDVTWADDGTHRVVVSERSTFW